MTSDEAISIMNIIVHMLEPQYDTDRIEDAVEMAIKALEQEPCEDCISRKQAIELFVCWWSDLLEHQKEDECFDALLKTLPPVTPQQRWQKVRDNMTDKEIIRELKNFVEVLCDDVSDRPSGCDFCKLWKDGNCAVDVLYEKMKAESEDKE